MATKYLRGPENAWDTLLETLNLDAESHMFDKKIRADIRRALSHVEYMEAPPHVVKVLFLTRRQKNLLVELLRQVPVRGRRKRPVAQQLMAALTIQNGGTNGNGHDH